MAKYLDPKVDLAFKRVFGEHKELLRSFLNAVLPLADDAQITDLEYLPPEQVPEIPGLLKNSIVDVKCVDQKGRIFIVEMQMLWRSYFEQRILFGASQAYVKQLKKGQDYSALQPVYALALIDDIFDHHSDQYYHHYKIVNIQDTQTTLPGLEFVFIELKKFKPNNRDDKRMKVLWLRFLSEISEFDPHPAPELLAEAPIASALDLVEIAAFSESELDNYNANMDQIRTARMVLDEALAMGRAEGREVGREEERYILIKNLHASGMSLEAISQATQLPLADVKRYLVR